MEITKGFYASIYKDDSQGKCSNRGISYFFDDVTIVSEIKELQVFDISPGVEIRRPLVIIKEKKLFGKKYVYAEPIDKPKGIGWMMGGSFIYSCDSRFRDNVNDYPIPLHDREETLEEYEVLSR